MLLFLLKKCIGSEWQLMITDKKQSPLQVFAQAKTVINAYKGNEYKIEKREVSRMYAYRHPYRMQDQRWGFGLPFLGGLAGGLLGGALFYPRPFYGGYGYPGYPMYPCCGPGFYY